MRPEIHDSIPVDSTIWCEAVAREQATGRSWVEFSVSVCDFNQIERQASKGTELMELRRLVRVDHLVR